MTQPPRTKRAELIRLLRRKSGAELKAITRQLEWQPHSVRAAISGLRKIGYTVERTDSSRPGGNTRYRLTGAPASGK